MPIHTRAQGRTRCAVKDCLRLFQKASTKILLYLMAIGYTVAPMSKAPRCKEAYPICFGTQDGYHETIVSLVDLNFNKNHPNPCWIQSVRAFGVIWPAYVRE